MSKIGKKPIVIPEAVTVEIKDDSIRATGKQGALELPILPYCAIAAKEENGVKALYVSVAETHRQARANWGTMAALIKNAIAGVSEGFQKKLQLEGVGYRASLEGKTLVLMIGFSHPVKYTPPEGIAIVVEKNIITISGINRAIVGEFAARIRKIRKPEPYQGKGIRYVGEIVRRKAGKKVGTGAGAAGT